MDIQNLTKVINEGNFNTSFEFDQAGQTWGVSYIRIVVGGKREYDSREQFFMSCFKSSNNIYSMTGSGETWEERANMANWANGLSVVRVSSSKVLDFIHSSLKEHEEEHRKYNHDMVIDSAGLELPSSFDDCWFITETVDVKHFINTTEYYFGESKDVYVLAEGHWES